MIVTAATTWRARAALAAVPVLLSGVVVLLYRVNPEGSDLFPKCPFRTLTGLVCPGCGATRAAHQLLHGKVLEAVRLNPLLVVAGPMLVYGTVSEFRQMSGRRPLPPLFASPVLAWLTLGLVVIFWVVRNLPFEPFRRLYP